MDIEAVIEDFLVNEIMLADNSTKIAPDESLIDLGVLDSLALLRLVMFIEEQFNLVVNDAEVIPENLETLNDIVSFVNKKSK